MSSKIKVKFYTKSVSKNCIRDIIIAGGSESNTKLIDLNLLNKNYKNPTFYPRKFENWPDTFSLKMLENNILSIKRTDISTGGWGDSLIIDVEDNIFLEEEKLKDKKIPRVIYQTFKSKELTKGMYDAVSTWINLNPEYEHYFYDDENCIEFIKSNFDPQVLETYFNLIPGAFKADLWRCCVLYKNGGVYADSDMMCLQRLEEFISCDDEFIVARDDPMSKSFLYNAFIACVPNHDFLLQQIESIVENVKYRKNVFYLDIAGPGLLGKSVNNCLGRDLNAEFNLGDNKTEKYNFKVLFHDWKSKTINHDQKKIVFTEYLEKNKEMSIEKIPTYYSLYQKGIVYKKIPRNIYFTAEDRLGINDYMFESFENKNKHWKLEFFSSSEREDFLKKHKKEFIDLLGYDVFKRYFEIKNGGAKADFWRYCVIYLNGGVYTDSDTFCEKPLDDWILSHDLILGIEACISPEKDVFGLKTVGKLFNNKLISVCNWTFAAEPRHEFFKNIIIDLCKQDINFINNNPATIATGPKVFTKHAFDYFSGCDFSLLEKNKDIEKNSSILFSIDRFGSNQGHSNSSPKGSNENIFVVHYFDGAWRSIPNKKIKKYKSKLGVSHNLALKKTKEGYLGVARLDKDTSRTKFLKKIGDCRSLLKIDFDKNFKLIKESENLISNFKDPAKFEDYRIFSFKGKDFYSVSYIDINFNTKVSILDENFNYLGDVKLLDRELNKAWDKIWEKNWLFFEKDDLLYFIYSTTPNYVLYICKDFNNLEFETFININWPFDGPKDNLYFGDVVSTGGSTNPIYLKDKNLFLYLIHTKIYQERKYDHYFVLLDENLKPIKFCERPVISKHISEPLCFVSSLILEDDYFVFSGGISDNENFIWELSKDFIFRKIIGI